MLPPTDPRYLEATDLQMELEFEHFKAANPHLKPKDESYADPNFDAAEQELDQEAKIDLDQIEVEQGTGDIYSDDARQRALDIVKKLQEDEWEDVPLDDGGESV